ncbi:unnamed protein product [Cylindrotheca closterium]|uniref:Circumsporozoite protein n=1 Tax=Cylindrotheca closterium TaxID=2856 RepID=A0AAD2CRY0_9STRA|nr:unnamed protein product [Cylindrotheca closterium]
MFPCLHGARCHFKRREGTGRLYFEQFKNVFQDEKTLELLNLASPVKSIESTTVFHVQASSSPSSSPSQQESKTCAAIANGTPVPDQDALTVQKYNILMDVILDSETEEMPLLTMELKQMLQRFLMPSLAGCTNQQSPCLCYVIHLDIYVQRIVSAADFLEDIMAMFCEAPLVERLGLLSPFKNIVVVGNVPDINDSTSSSVHQSTFPLTESPSMRPSWAPVTYPTTDNPTRSPTIAPSLSPTRAPSVTFPTSDDPTRSSTTASTPIGTRGPTRRPTPMPTLQPVVGPTLEPTPFPTPGPTPFPTSHPTLLPTRNPSKVTSAAPTPKPSLSPTPKPSSSPTPEPTSSPTTKPSVRPTMQPTTSPPTPKPSASSTARPSATPKPCFQTNVELSDVADDYFDTKLKASIEAQYGLIRNWCLKDEQADKLMRLETEVSSSERFFEEECKRLKKEHELQIESIDCQVDGLRKEHAAKIGLENKRQYEDLRLDFESVRDWQSENASKLEQLREKYDKSLKRIVQLEETLKHEKESCKQTLCQSSEEAQRRYQQLQQDYNSLLTAKRSAGNSKATYRQNLET